MLPVHNVLGECIFVLTAVEGSCLLKKGPSSSVTGKGRDKLGESFPERKRGKGEGLYLSEVPSFPGC